MATMIDLKLFPKLGVRVPVALRRRVKQALLDLDNAGVKLDGDEVTMEAVFAAATIHVLEMEPEKMHEAFRKRMPQLLAMFQAEMTVPGNRGEPEGADEAKGKPVTKTIPGKASRPRKSQSRDIG